MELIQRHLGDYMGRKLYVGNLSYNVDSKALEDHFSGVGLVEKSTVIMDRETGRSKGFGFVEMADETLAAEAIERFDGTDLQGRSMKVSEAKEKPRTSSAGQPNRSNY